MSDPYSLPAAPPPLSLSCPSFLKGLHVCNNLNAKTTV